MDEAFELHLLDNTQAWELQADASYRRVSLSEHSPAISAQTRLLKI